MLSAVSNWRLPVPRAHWVPHRISPSLEEAGATSALGYSATSPTFSPMTPLGGPGDVAPNFLLSMVPGGVGFKQASSPADSPEFLPSMVQSVPRVVGFKQTSSPADSPIPLHSGLRWGSPGPNQLEAKPAVEASRIILTRSRLAQAVHDSVRQTRSASRGVVKPKARSKKAGIDLLCYESL